MHRRCRMSDEKPVPETLQTIGEKIAALGKRFDAVDERFDAVDQRFDEVKAQLRTEIDSVRGDVRIVAEAVAAQTMLLKRMNTNHRRLGKRVEDHDLSILALEPKKRA